MKYERGLSLFLILYVCGLLTVLLGVHVLQPDWEGLGTSSKSPVHQDRQKAKAQRDVRLG